MVEAIYTRKRSRSEEQDADIIGDGKVFWFGKNEAAIRLGTTPTCLTGRGKLCLKFGKVALHGHSLKIGQWYPFESPSWTSWLTLVNEENEGAASEVEVVSSRRGPDELVPTFEIKSGIDSTSRPTVIPSKWSEALETVLSDLKSNESKRTCARNDVIHEDSPGTSNAPQQGNNASRGLKLVVVGAKSVGKSTCVRLAINRILLSSANRVCVLDADLGQPEFSPPGMLSLTIVDKPIFSQPHIHIITNSSNNSGAAKRHEAAYWFGATSSQSDPEGYAGCISGLLHRYYELLADQPDLPLVINMDGWVKGLGLQILDAVLATICPTHVIQILGHLTSKIFDVSLPTESKLHVCHAFNVHRSISLDPTVSQIESSEEPESSLPSSHSLADIKCFSTSPSSIPAHVLRTLRLLSYFLDDISLWDKIKFGQKCLIADGNCILSKRLAAQKPYTVPFEAVRCTFTAEEAKADIHTLDMILDALNGSIVGLCSEEQSKNCGYFPCVGLGLIRAIDRVKKVFYILTPVDPETLHLVNVVVKGQIPLPLECYFRGAQSDSFHYQNVGDYGASLPGADPMRSRNSIARK